ncbi:TonB-dependent siderophore receptor [Bradyrhizobium frederickii]|uniref:TonB-dependent siderophore receptor n=1 Tax=Bradyrhizobium frederickii TaxID=2560054 RepID=A0A4Y9PJE0_9BRAD|nr:TonB-dependent siderophore receptor [Bradyrhizobium frederickii]TFV78663.1 TonB-dependent siderophore receptor [Bradyrhizobium frederickii]
MMRTFRAKWFLHVSVLVTTGQLIEAVSVASAQAISSTNLPPVVVEHSKPRPARRTSHAIPPAAPRAATAQPKPAPESGAANETARGPVRGVVAHRSATGSKTDASILEVPQSITVVTRDQMTTQGVRTVAEALRYEPGVVSETRVGDRFDGVFIRGFGGFGANANYLHFWDGLRLPRGVSYAMPSIDPYLLERVEVLRGPASVLYGQNNLGGMVNLISKSPTAAPQGEVMARFGDHNRIEGGFDVGGPLTKDGQLLYRLIGLARKADTEVNYTTTERELIAPMVTWRPTLDTTFTLRAVHDRDPSSYQPNTLPALGTLQANPNGQIPRSFFAGHPNYNTYDRTQDSIAYEFEHRFDDTWAVRQNFRYMNISSDFKALSVTGFGAGSTCGAGTTANLCLARTSTHYLETLQAAAIDNQVEARFATGWLQHTVLMGGDYQTSSADATFGNGTSTNVNYLNPNYGTIVAPALTTQTVQNREQTGVYLQDQMRLGKLALVLGVRNDWANAFSDTRTIATGAYTNRSHPSDSATTWRAGATYLFDNGLAPYASYSTSFEPTIGTDYTGAAFAPTTGEQYEIGVKYQPTGFNGMFMLSLYDITQNNVLTIDTTHLYSSYPACTQSGIYCQIQQGQVRSKGIELSAKVSPLPGLDLIAAFSHNDIEITRSTQVVSGIAIQGKAPVGAPANTASLWADYTLQSGQLAGFGFGGGIRYVGESFGDNINSMAMVVPAYTLADLMLHYDLHGLSPQLKGWKLAFNMTNVFDKTYVSACASSTQCFYGSGRATMGTIKYQW